MTPIREQLIRKTQFELVNSQIRDGKKLPPPPNAPDLLKQLLNDSGNAERLVALYGDTLRYCHDFKKWMCWDGRRWAVDTTEQAKKYAKETMIQFLRQAAAAGRETEEKFARGSLDHKRIINLLALAQPELPIQARELDQKPDLITFLNGTVNLKTGTLLSCRQDDFISKLVHYNYIPEARCPTWLAFLNQIMGAGADASEETLSQAAELVDYLQRALGYSLTGRTNEKAVFVCFGSGDNGKSTMLSTFRQLVEEYSVLLQVDTLMVRQESNNTQADLADLRGARFVQTSETEEGQRLAQGKLKRITQGMGKIKAVRKYENPIEFEETHKLWIDSNNLPVITNADDKATFNRLHPIPFKVTIPREQIDRELPLKLLREAEGVLAWSVVGAKIYYESGLQPPTEIKRANDDWHTVSDQLGRFIAECCICGDQFRVQARALYEAYVHWTERTNEKGLLTETAFGLKMTAPDRGFIKDKKNGSNFYFSIGLLASNER